jgi:Na+/H+-translocating membrane pyrophosphatase
MRLATEQDRAKVAKQAMRKLVIPFSLAIVIDGVLQYLTLGYVRPMAALLVGAVLIFIPFAISRSFTNRIYRHRHPRPAHA